MIILAGDCHGDFREVLATVAGYSPDTIAGIFFLGDQTPNRPLEQELAPLGTQLLARTWFILGNHDSDHPRFLRNHLGMWDHHLHNKVITVDGVRMGGVSGIFRKDIWYPPEKALWQDRTSLGKHELFEGQLPLKHWTTIFPEDLAAPWEPMDILLTHEAPGSHAYGFDVLDHFARRRGVQWIFHGHHHEDSMGTLAPGIQVVGLGLCQCMVWDPSMLTHAHAAVSRSGSVT
ncbi:metallophosphoesterase family protein [Desulfoplanes formicivorans]|uniref:Metallophosphoesterase n=1 Tax=Desulfoplanes formicivorans TaxID=1592317 RepID=A0A194AGU8_9BACT|nr:metallophosphoesterase [Desulfoplanes formicivorans]GAU08435.1 metallophosphoesterase [Desulfoplanes formicivorans]